MRVKKENKWFDALEIFYSIFMIGILMIVLVNSLQYFLFAFPITPLFEGQMFLLGSIVAIVTVISQWISGRIKAIIRIFNKKRSKK